VVSLLASRSANALELNTALVRTNANDASTYRCTVTNVSSKAIGVTLTLINSAGVLENVPVEVNVAPNGTLAAILPGDDAGGIFCRASGKFSKKNVAMALQLQSSIGITQLSVPGQ
jgi:hypothetical protein